MPKANGCFCSLFVCVFGWFCFVCLCLVGVPSKILAKEDDPKSLIETINALCGD